jgi:diketogulonate reductase-like aldo/keto reductase
VRTGKIRWYGVSNFDASELAEAVRIAGPGRIACNQILYHLAERSSENDVIPLCEAHDVAVVGYTPFGRAEFPPPRGRAVLERLAAARGVTPRQLALAFLTRRPSLFAIPKASDARHVEENARARELVLTPAELLEVEQAFPRGGKRATIARI